MNSTSKNFIIAIVIVALIGIGGFAVVHHDNQTKHHDAMMQTAAMKKSEANQAMKQKEAAAMKASEAMKQAEAAKAASAPDGDDAMMHEGTGGQ